MIYYGKIATEILQKNLENRKFSKCKGIFLDSKMWIAFDNSTYNCWVEEFKTQGLAICWLMDLFEVSQLKDFKVVRNKEGLYVIPGNRVLGIQFLSDTLVPILL